MNVREILERAVAGELSLDDAEQILGTHGFAQIGFHRLDLQREHRTSAPEVIFGKSKSLEQLREIIGFYDERGLPLLATKVEVAKADALCSDFASLRYDPVSQLLSRGVSARPVIGRVAVVAAGSSDAPVAEEASGTLQFFGADAVKAYDCGVAGIHRLFASSDLISSADVLIVVAGMEGALASVVGGLFRQPIIGVPTSVGYGSSFEGLAALLAMLNSCAPGVTVVNIDNGFGAAVAAKAMLGLRKQN